MNAMSVPYRHFFIETGRHMDYPELLNTVKVLSNFSCVPNGDELILAILSRIKVQIYGPFNQLAFTGILGIINTV